MRSAGSMVVASSSEPTLAAALATMHRTLSAHGDPATVFGHIVAFFSLTYDAIAVADGLAQTFPGIAISGCSTAGELTPLGMIDGSIMLLAFPRATFRVLAEVIDEVDTERATGIVRRLKAEIATGRNPASGIFALLLVDGLSKSEERVVAAVHWAMDDIQLVGGSSGDSLAFEHTALIHGGRMLRNAAVLLMIETTTPFRIFKTQNFQPTATKLVVTAADTENRIVYELNAEPAAREYATAIGLLPDDLGPFSFASHPLVVKVGGDYYCRSIRNVNPDGSLTFFCAIDEGLVFTVATPQDMISATEAVLDGIDRSLGGIDMAIGFDCILRRLDAQNRQVTAAVDELYRRYRIVGFNSYGEQYNAMHLNQTLTGIAFGRTVGTSADE
jgi:hypothetical protein